MKKADELSALSKTLFIPLAVRAKETIAEHPLLTDKKAVEIFNQCDTGHMVTDGGEISSHGVLARTIVVDDEVKRILEQNPKAVVINLGAGLDTRFFRLNAGTVQWYDLDLPEVISFRREFLPENEQVHFIARSVLDASWTDEIKCAEDDTVIILAEGLLMYFTEKEVREILQIVGNAFPGADMFFDVVHSYFVGKKISSDFHWGISKIKEIVNLNSNIKIVRSWSAGALIKKRQSLAFRILNIFPSTNNRSRIIQLKLTK